MKHCMPPIINSESEILILGSLPGEKSLQLQEYYAHPQNHFWKIICTTFNNPLPQNYNDKVNIILSNKLALWDVIKCANRENSSLDNNIKNVTPNNIDKLLIEYPNIKKILLNGNKSFTLYNKYFKNLQIQYLKVPSTSPAYASMSFNEKFLAWNDAFIK